MRVLGFTTLALTAAFAAPPALAVDLPPLPPVQLPPLPPVSTVVPLPPVQLPPVPTPRAPVPTPTAPVATVVPTAPTATPAPESSPAAAAGASTTRAESPARPAATPTASGARRAPARPARRVRAPSPRQRTAYRRPRAGAATEPVALRPAPATAGEARPRVSAPPPAAKHARPGPATGGLTGDVVDIVRALPPAVLWGLIASLALALGLAGNAFWQSRRRTALERQRTALLEDIGLLSSALLPTMPEGLNGLTVSAAYEPAEGPAAGGDFYDVFALDEARVGVLLGDVSGHGRASLRHAALARYTLRTLLADGHGPGEALARADALLSRELPPHFVTVIAGVYDHRTAELSYAKAGHAPPIVLGAPYDGAAEQPACPIGLGLGESWPEYRLELGDGVTVGLVTDGLEDARTGGERLGRDRVERLLGELSEPDAAALLGGVRGLADTLPDDTAAVVLTRRAS